MFDLLPVICQQLNAGEPSWRDWWLLTSEYARLLRTVIVLLGGVIALHILWAALRPFIFWLVAPAGITRLVACALSEALRQGRDPGEALRTAAVGLPIPWSYAACDVAEGLQIGETLPDALLRRGLVRRDAARLGAAALRLGGAAPQRWLDDLATPPPGHQRLRDGLAPIAASAVIAVGIIGFIGHFIVPKFEQICRDLAVAPAPTLNLVATITQSPWTKVVVLLLVLGGVALVVAWGWRGLRRRSAAGLIATATAAGASEAEIASALGVPDGSVAGICRACGWRAADRDSLLRTMAAEAEAAERRAALLATLARIALPLLLAVPVWLLADAIFGTLINMLVAIEAAG